MKTISKLAAAALLITAAAPALADHRDRDCDHDDGRAVTIYPASPIPSPAGWRDDARYGDRDDRYGDRDDRWRQDGWRARERARLRVEFARLDDQRADFYARWGWHPRKVARFERWYTAERAELQRRWDALGWRYAAR
jgi:hypothetical protein